MGGHAFSVGARAAIAHQATPAAALAARVGITPTWNRSVATHAPAAMTRVCARMNGTSCFWAML